MDTNNEDNLIQENLNTEQEILELEQDPNSNLGMNFDFYSPFRVDAKNTSEASWEIFLQKVNNLSIPVKSVLTGEDTVEFIITLAEDLEFTDEQSANFSRILRDVLVGDLLINNLAITLSKKLDLNQDMAKRIYDHITNNLLNPIAEDIKKLQTNKYPGGTSNPTISPRAQPPRVPERPDLKIEPEINRNNVVDLRNKQ